MGWDTQSINHSSRMRLGISINEYVVLDYIYKTQTHPDFGGQCGGWCETPLSRISDFLGISKSALSDLMKRMTKIDLLEENTTKRRTTQKWYRSYIYGNQPNESSETERNRSETEQGTIVYKEEVKEEGNPTSEIGVSKQKEKAKNKRGSVSHARREHFVGFANPDLAMEIWLEWMDFKKDQFRKTYKTEASEKVAIEQLLSYSGGSIPKARTIVKRSIAGPWMSIQPYDEKSAINIPATQPATQTPPEDTYQLPEELQARYEASTKWFYENCHLCAGIRWLSKQEYEKIQNKDSDFIGAMWYAHCVSSEFSNIIRASLKALNQLPRWDKEKWQSVYEWLKKDVSGRIFPRQK